MLSRDCNSYYFVTNHSASNMVLVDVHDQPARTDWCQRDGYKGRRRSLRGRNSAAVSTALPPRSSVCQIFVHIISTFPYQVMPKRTRSGPSTFAENSTTPLGNAHLLKFLHVGDTVEVYWPLMHQFYQGRVVRQENGGRHRIEYDDGDVEVLLMRDEIWRFRGESAERVVVHILGSLKKMEH